MRGFRGWTLLDLRIWANPSDFEVGLEKNREKTVVGDDLRGISVYTVEAEETIGDRILVSLLMSPVWTNVNKIP